MNIIFQSVSTVFTDDTLEYRLLWEEEGSLIIKALTKITNLTFKQKEIVAVVYDGPSFSGNQIKPMKLRANLPLHIKKGTLIHELGHRLIGPLQRRLVDLDEHQHLNLFLYDTWVELYGQEFADTMIIFESSLEGNYDYKVTWNWLKGLSREERHLLWEKFVALNQNK